MAKNLYDEVGKEVLNIASKSGTIDVGENFRDCIYTTLKKREEISGNNDVAPSIFHLFREVDHYNMAKSDLANDLRAQFYRYDSYASIKNILHPSTDDSLDKYYKGEYFFNGMATVMTNNKLAWRESLWKHIKEEMKEWMSS